MQIQFHNNVLTRSDDEIIIYSQSTKQLIEWVRTDNGEAKVEWPDAADVRVSTINIPYRLEGKERREHRAILISDMLHGDKYHAHWYR
nr:hypothetical protein [Rhizobium sp. ACO-34A]